MYKDEFWEIIKKQKKYHPFLEDVQEDLFAIIFFQRPLKLEKDRVGQWNRLDPDDREKIIELFEKEAKPTISKIKKVLGFSRNQKFNFESATNKSFKGNITEIDIRSIFPEWDEISCVEQNQIKKTLGNG
ncbi:MAG: hypothetical protein GY820_32665 [Gammaproteobacteria bacterium]|nr:hypothetical protein [Gammaproteobacteria bacterium]